MSLVSVHLLFSFGCFSDGGRSFLQHRQSISLLYLPQLLLLHAFQFGRVTYLKEKGKKGSGSGEEGAIREHFI